MKRVVIFCMVFLFLISLSGCFPNHAARQVRLNSTEEPPKTAAPKQQMQTPLRVAVSSILSPRETLTVYQPLLEYLEIKLASPVVLLQRKTYKEVNELLQNGGADVAFVCSGGYAAGSQTFGMELLAMPQVQGKRTYQSFIIAKQEVKATSIADLNGRSFAFTDPMSFSGRIAPVYMLLSQGIEGDQFFSRTFFTYSHDNAIKAVYDGIVDAAAVDSMIFEQAAAVTPAILQKVKIVDKSMLVGNPPVVVNAAVNRDLKERLRYLLLTMHDDEAGKKSLAALKYDRFTAPEDEYYAGLKPIWLSIKEKL